jgi:hypothetical protein
MDLHASFEVLSDVVEQFESSGKTFQNVEVTSETENDTLLATLSIPLPLCSASGGGLEDDIQPKSARLSDGGGLTVEFETGQVTSLVEPTEAAVSLTERAVRVVDDELVLTVELMIDPAGADGRTTQTAETTRQRSGNSTDESESDPSSSTSEPREAVRDDSIPLYEDTAYLKALYESCETFTDMSDVIEMDISSETIRRYMIEADIHQPTTYDTNAEAVGVEDDTSTADDDGTEEAASAQSPLEPADPREMLSNEQLVTDGVGLPADLELTEVADAVVDSKSMYGVATELGLEQERTRKLLQKLDLIDLVMHRVADESASETSYEEIATRIRTCGLGEVEPKR